jgi:hypothetical protein
MEIFALITLNIAMGLGLYIFLSLRMTKIVKENQGKQLENRVRMVYSDFIRDSSQTIELLESKIKGLRDLTIRSEKVLEYLKEESSVGSGVSIQLQNLINQSKDVLDGHSSPNKAEQSYPVASYPLTAASHTIPFTVTSKNITSYQEIKTSRPIEEESKVRRTRETPKEDTNLGIIAGIGKKVKSAMGLDSILPTSQVSKEPSRENLTNKLAYIVEGDPFEMDEEDTIHDIEEEKRREEGSFLSALKEVSKEPRRGDSVEISLESVLADLPSSSTKIDKVVHLLKKGYSHEEIADGLDLGTREVSLIETVRLERGRRR